MDCNTGRNEAEGGKVKPKQPRQETILRTELGACALSRGILRKAVGGDSHPLHFTGEEPVLWLHKVK